MPAPDMITVDLSVAASCAQEARDLVVAVKKRHVAEPDFHRSSACDDDLQDAKTALKTAICAIEAVQKRTV